MSGWGDSDELQDELGTLRNDRDELFDRVVDLERDVEHLQTQVMQLLTALALAQLTPERLEEIRAVAKRVHDGDLDGLNEQRPAAGGTDVGGL